MALISYFRASNNPFRQIFFLQNLFVLLLLLRRFWIWKKYFKKLSKAIECLNFLLEHLFIFKKYWKIIYFKISNGFIIQLQSKPNQRVHFILYWKDSIEYVLLIYILKIAGLFNFENNFFLFHGWVCKHFLPSGICEYLSFICKCPMSSKYWNLNIWDGFLMFDR